jgi:hypothetical protein
MDITYIPGFMRIGSGLQVILRFCLKNLRGSDVGISIGRDLYITPLKWGELL